jgi:aryl-alcohol dehydrogenase-like predicted oxidoreductase
MEFRSLGNSAVKVSPLCFGGNVFGWTIDESRSFEILNAFADAGCNFIDTADSYSNWVPGNRGGESESIIGKWMKQRKNRKDIVIATKLGSDLGDGNRGLSREYMFKAVEASLKRLQTDYIDVYQAHYDDPSTPVEETLLAFSDLITQGKVRIIGASNFSRERLTASLSTSKEKQLPSYQTIQPLYNLYERQPFEAELQSVCIDNGISVITYFSLASGFLTGKYRTEHDLGKSTRGQGIKKYFTERGFRILRALDTISAEHNVTNASIALAWLMSRPAVAAPIASATNEGQLRELLQSTEIRLSEHNIDMLNRASE